MFLSKPKQPSGRQLLLRWCRHFEERALQRAGALARLGRAGRRLLRPITALVRAVQYSGQYGPRIQREQGVVRWRQLRDLWLLRVVYDLDPEDYYLNELYREERWAQVNQYVDFRRNLYLLDRFVEATSPREAKVLRDKRLFYEHCRTHGLPTVPVLLEVEAGEITCRAWKRRTSLPPVNLFVKPARGQQGAGSSRWKHLGSICYAFEGEVLSEAELIRRLQKASEHTPLIVQPAESNRKQLARFSKGALCTYRIITGRSPDGAPEHVASIFRMPRDEAWVDNYSQGGLAAPVDATTGRLGPARYLEGKLKVRTTTHHPATRARIEGAVLPHWSEALALVRQAHSTFNNVAFVAWDVALTAQGLLLLEGNTTWSFDTLQERGTPIGETAVPVFLDQHMRALAAS